MLWMTIPIAGASHLYDSVLRRPALHRVRHCQEWIDLMMSCGAVPCAVSIHVLSPLALAIVTTSITSGLPFWECPGIVLAGRQDPHAHDTTRHHSPGDPAGREGASDQRPVQVPSDAASFRTSLTKHRQASRVYCSQGLHLGVVGPIRPDRLLIVPVSPSSSLTQETTRDTG